jgi:hypothetical protein
MTNKETNWLMRSKLIKKWTLYYESMYKISKMVETSESKKVNGINEVNFSQIVVRSSKYNGGLGIFGERHEMRINLSLFDPI